MKVQSAHVKLYSDLTPSTIWDFADQLTREDEVNSQKIWERYD